MAGCTSSSNRSDRHHSPVHPKVIDLLKQMTESLVSMNEHMAALEARSRSPPPALLLKESTDTMASLTKSMAALETVHKSPPPALLPPAATLPPPQVTMLIEREKEEEGLALFVFKTQSHVKEKPEQDSRTNPLKERGNDAGASKLAPRSSHQPWVTSRARDDRRAARPPDAKLAPRAAHQPWVSRAHDGRLAARPPDATSLAILGGLLSHPWLTTLMIY